MANATLTTDHYVYSFLPVSRSHAGLPKVCRFEARCSRLAETRAPPGRLSWLAMNQVQTNLTRYAEIGSQRLRERTDEADALRSLRTEIKSYARRTVDQACFTVRDPDGRPLILVRYRMFETEAAFNNQGLSEPLTRLQGVQEPWSFVSVVEHAYPYGTAITFTSHLNGDREALDRYRPILERALTGSPSLLTHQALHGVDFEAWKKAIGHLCADAWRPNTLASSMATLASSTANDLGLSRLEDAIQVVQATVDFLSRYDPSLRQLTYAVCLTDQERQGYEAWDSLIVDPGKNDAENLS